MDGLTLVQFQYKESSPPLGALYLSDALDQEGIPFDLRIFPKFELAINMDRLYSFLGQSRRILAIGCWSNVLPYLSIVLERIKKRFPEKTIILGGIGPTEVAEEMIQTFPWIDYIIQGCGISPFPKLVKKILNHEKVFSDISGFGISKRERLLCASRLRFLSEWEPP